MKIETRKIKNARGRIVGHRASFGVIERDGATAAEAMAAVECRLTQLADGRQGMPVVEIVAGHVVVVAQGPNMLHRYVVDPDGHVSRLSESAETDSGEAMERARYHVAQMIWPAPGAADLLRTDRGREEFARWAEFQERYADARGRGMSDTEAHSYAGRNPQRPDLWA